MCIQYGRDLYVSASLAEIAEKYLEHLPKEVTALVTTGSSGHALASAMLVLADQRGRGLRHFVIRKPGEEAHGGPWIYPCRVDRVTFAIVDDFISMGDTIKRILAEIAKYGGEELFDLRCILVERIDLPRQRRVDRLGKRIMEKVIEVNPPTKTTVERGKVGDGKGA
jgi:orotate phosphoribosyltransferase-like protein